jgi:acyl carrier protein
VAIQHGSLLNCLLSMQRRPGFGPDDTLLSVTPLSFDISLCEIFLPLISGARLILPSLETAANPRAVKRLLEDNDVTVMQATPVMWRTLIEEGWKGSTLLRVWCGGETMPPALAESLLDRAAEVWNLYGPTETTIWSTVHRVGRGESPVPIGRPIANTQCYVLDRNLQPVPDGVPGDLFIGGAGVSPGYLGHASAQQDRFPPNPFVPGSRMYRTGDMVLWPVAGNTTGHLIFLHRKDTQVKVRGHRIELGEVETALCMLSMVQQAAVAVRDEALVAWVAPTDRALWNPKQLRAELRLRLPEYMVPGIFVPVDRLPVNSSGKVDRSKLPPPETRTRGAEEPNDAPETEADLISLALRDLWEELLDVRPIGLEDDFFELGGHSLLAAKLFGRIEKVFGKRLPDSVLFQAPTIAGIASILRNRGGCTFSTLVPIKPLGNRPPFFCIPGFGVSILDLRELGRSLGPDQPVYGIQPAGWDGTELPDIRVEAMADRYAREIRALQPDGPYYLGGTCFGGVVAFETARQLMAMGERVGLLVILNTIERSELKRSAARNRRIFGYLLRHVQRNLREWTPLPARAKLSYIFLRLAPRLQRALLSTLIFEGVYKACSSAAIPFPSGSFWINMAHRIAVERYRPRPLPGANRVMLFKTATAQTVTEDPTLGWAALAPNGLEIEEMPGADSWAWAQPHVKVLAAMLDHRLRVAQATAGQEEQP